MCSQTALICLNHSIINLKSIENADGKPGTQDKPQLNLSIEKYTQTQPEGILIKGEKQIL